MKRGQRNCQQFSEFPLDKERIGVFCRVLIQCCITGKVEQLGVTEVDRDGPNPGVVCVLFVVLEEIVLPP